MSGVQLVLTSTMIVSIISSMIFMVAGGFKVNRPYGIYLVALYVVFLTVALIAESGLLLDGWASS